LRGAPCSRSAGEAARRLYNIVEAMPSTFHLAQVNVARLVAPLDSPQLAGFVSRLDEVNALADGAPGFVWRLKDDVTNNATAVPVYDDDKIIVNMSVWESIEALRAFTYSGAHLEVYKQRREWFSLMKEASAVMWWVRAGHLPDVAEARDRLAHLRAHGPTAYAFPFGAPFPAPPEPPGEVPSTL
jgi:heme-degrading monooxygenase HmoA